MKIDYQKIIEFMTVSGKRLVKRAGNISDIGITKKDLTEEDLAIERGFKKIISEFGDDHILYAEEENDKFQRSNNLWVVDPISGTENFIKGLPHYSIVISHLQNHKAVFAAIYDPTVNELYTAYKNKGAFLNDQRIKVNQNLLTKIILRVSSGWKRPDIVKKVNQTLSDYEIENNRYSMAVNYCSVARGLFDGIISLTKDSFPEFAGGLIIREAGGKFTNLKEQSDISPDDRVFVGGNDKSYKTILPLIERLI